MIETVLTYSVWWVIVRLMDVFSVVTMDTRKYPVPGTIKHAGAMPQAPRWELSDVKVAIFFAKMLTL